MTQPELRDWLACMARREDWEPHLIAGHKEVECDIGGTKQVFYSAIYRTPSEARYAFADDMLKARGI